MLDFWANPNMITAESTHSKRSSHCLIDMNTLNTMTLVRLITIRYISFEILHKGAVLEGGGLSNFYNLWILMSFSLWITKKGTNIWHICDNLYWYSIHLWYKFTLIVRIMLTKYLVYCIIRGQNSHPLIRKNAK